MNPADSAAVALRGASLAFRNKEKLDSSSSSSSPSLAQQKQQQQQYSHYHYHQKSHSRSENGAYTASASATRTTTTTSSTGSGSGSPTRSAAARGLQAAQAAAEGNAVEVDPQQQTQQHQQHQQQAATAATSRLVLHHNHNHQRHKHLGVAMTAAAATAAHHPGSQMGYATAVGGGKVDAKSTSLIAATLAAGRSASPTAASRGKVRRKGSVGGLSSASSSASEPAPATVVDSGSIAPTGSLISMFERARGGGPAGGAAERVPQARVSPPELTGSVSEEQPGGPGKAALMSKSKARLDPKPPTPPPVRKANPKGFLHNRPPSPPLANPLHPTPAEVTPSKPSRPKPSPSTAGHARSKSAAAAAASPIPPRPSPLLSISQSASQAHSPQPHPLTPSRGISPPTLPASSRRPKTPTSVPNNTQPSTPVTLSTKKPASSPLSESINRPNTVTVSSTPQPKPKASHLEPRPRTPPVLSPLMSRSVAEVLSPQPTRVSKTPLSPVTSPHLALSPKFQAISSPSPDPQKRSSTAKHAPTPPKPRGSNRLGRDQPTSRPKETSIGAVLHPDVKPPSSSTPGRQTESRPLLPARRQSVVSAPPSPTQVPRRRFTNASVSNLHLDSLADAIVAGSLASSRLTPHNTGPALPPAGQPKRHKSPRLLQTLRQPVSLSDEESDRHWKALRPKLNKGKHAHHEGSRRKWREEIRPRERKRYEALWASNRGTLLVYGSSSSNSSSSAASVSSGAERDVSQYVVSIVVREIWRRSRLPMDELAEIWDLVDREGAGMLSRPEFVVGTWLVDQRLKGRKVPAKVMDSVWGSANGVTVKKPSSFK